MSLMNMFEIVFLNPAIYKENADIGQIACRVRTALSL